MPLDSAAEAITRALVNYANRLLAVANLKMILMIEDENGDRFWSATGKLKKEFMHTNRLERRPWGMFQVREDGIIKDEFRPPSPQPLPPGEEDVMNENERETRKSQEEKALKIVGKDVVNGEKRKTKESQEAKAPKIAKILPEEKTQLPTLVKEVSPVPEKSNPEETKSKLDETSMKSKRNSSKPTSDKSNSNTSDIKSNSKLDKSSSRSSDSKSSRSTSDRKSTSESFDLKSSSTSISDTKSRITSDTKSSSRSTADTKSSSRSTSDTKSSRSSNKKSDIGSRMTQIAYFGNTTSSKSADTKSRSTSGSKSRRSTADTKSSSRSPDTKWGSLRSDTKSLRSTADTKSSLRSTSDLKPSSKSSKHSSSHDRHEDPPRRQPSEPIASSAFCSKCLAIGHLRVNCPKKDLENGRKPFSVFCNMEGDGLANISDDELDYDPATKPIHPASIDSRLTQLAYTGDVLSQAKFTHGRNIQSSWNPSMPVICNCCKLLGHTEDECPAKVDIEVCGICKLLGHVATECPMAIEKRLEEFTDPAINLEDALMKLRQLGKLKYTWLTTEQNFLVCIPNGDNDAIRKLNSKPVLIDLIHEFKLLEDR